MRVNALKLLIGKQSLNKRPFQNGSLQENQTNKKCHRTIKVRHPRPAGSPSSPPPSAPHEGFPPRSTPSPAEPRRLPGRNRALPSPRTHHKRAAVHSAGPHGGAEQAAPAAPAKKAPSEWLPRRGAEGHQRLGLPAGREQRGQQADRLAGRPIGAPCQPGALRRLVGGRSDGTDGVPRRQLHEGRGLRQGERQRLRGGRGRRRRRVPSGHPGRRVRLREPFPARPGGRRPGMGISGWLGRGMEGPRRSRAEMSGERPAAESERGAGPRSWRGGKLRRGPSAGSAGKALTWAAGGRHQERRANRGVSQRASCLARLSATGGCSRLPSAWRRWCVPPLDASPRLPPARRWIGTRRAAAARRGGRGPSASARRGRGLRRWAVGRIEERKPVRLPGSGSLRCSGSRFSFSFVFAQRSVRRACGQRSWWERGCAAGRAVDRCVPGFLLQAELWRIARLRALEARAA